MLFVSKESYLSQLLWIEQKAEVHVVFLASDVSDVLPGTADGHRAGNPIIKNCNKLLQNSLRLITFTCT